MNEQAESRVGRWELRTEWPLAAVAVAFLIAYATPILDTHLSHDAKLWFHATDLTAWAIFAVDYGIRLILATDRWHYWSRHLHDLAVIALPILRPLRLLRVIMLLRALNRSATDNLRGRIAVYVGGAAVLLLFCGSLAMLDAERGHPNSNIETFPDALWWAAATVTTVGYGDRYPVTSEGRIVGAALMLGGIALLGVVTASIASWLIDRVRDADEASAAATRRDVRALTARVDELSDLIRSLGGHVPRSAETPPDT
jgi:voltage-gated potassium channel